MTTDNTLLKLMGYKSNYIKYKKLIPIKTLAENTIQIIHDIGEYFNMYPDIDTIDWGIFSEWFRFVMHPSFTADESNLYATQFNRIKEVKDTCVSTTILKSLAERKCAQELIDLSYKVCHGTTEAPITDAKSILESLDNDIRKITNEVTEEDPDRVTDDVIELLSSVYCEETNGLDWPIEEMNISLGPFRKGDSVLIAAYVDTGKTLLTLNCCRAFVNQLKGNEQIIYFANEEQGRGIKYRFIQSCLGLTSAEMREDFSKILTKYRDFVKDPSRFVVYHNGIMDIRYIEDRLKRHNPGVIVIDQLHNVGGFEKLASTNTERVTELAKWTRRLAQLAPCIFTHQADGQCNGIKFIELHQLYGSKVGMQGAVDAVITLGKEHGSPQTELERGLYFPKNKLLGGRRCEDDKRKYKWNISIDPTKARIKGNI